jgi:tripartite-type tricarboxylate transporter receptor subunit TctC
MTNHPRLALLGALVVSIIWPAAAQPQNYPNRTITFVVPFAAGGLTDVPARILAAMMQERIGQNIVIENKPGATQFARQDRHRGRALSRLRRGSPQRGGRRN